jgi:hypothetical protein
MPHPGYADTRPGASASRMKHEQWNTLTKLAAAMVAAATEAQ